MKFVIGLIIVLSILGFIAYRILVPSDITIVPLNKVKFDSKSSIENYELGERTTGKYDNDEICNKYWDWIESYFPKQQTTTHNDNNLMKYFYFGANGTYTEVTGVFVVKGYWEYNAQKTQIKINLTMMNGSSVNPEKYNSILEIVKLTNDSLIISVNDKRVMCTRKYINRNR